MKKGKKNIRLRIIAGVLVVVMVFTYWAGAVTSIKIAADSSNEAMKYLAENTDYVKAGNNIDLTLKQGASIGENGNSVSVETGDGGKISVKAEGNGRLEDVYLESGKGLNLDNIKATGTVRLDAEGDITSANGGHGNLISANEAIINAEGGTAGTKNAPINLDVNKFGGSGTEISVNNTKGLEITSVTGEKDANDPEHTGNISIHANGDITAGDNNGKVNVTGNKVTIITTGDIGKHGESLKVDSDLLHTESKGLDIESGKDVLIDQIKATGDVNIDASGKVTGKDKNSTITGDKVTINAGRDIGADDKPLNIVATDSVKNSTKAGKVATKVRIVPKRRPVVNDEPVYDEWYYEEPEEDDDSYPVIILDNKVAKTGKIKIKSRTKSLAEEIEDEIEDKTDDTQPEKILKVTGDTEVNPVDDLIDDAEDIIPDNIKLMILLTALLVLIFTAVLTVVIVKNSNSKKADGTEA